uniref:Uncharacterized protein n=1 Tax=Sipha flava TaxID=143950 RepID=A0A2S2QH98_9HEMI
MWRMVDHGITIRSTARPNRTLVTRMWETIRCLHGYAVIVFNRKKTNTHKIKVGTASENNSTAIKCADRSRKFPHRYVIGRNRLSRPDTNIIAPLNNCYL